MLPEEVVVGAGAPAAQSVAVPLDVELQALDAELHAAGAQARRMLNGRRQPTRYFTLEVRRALLERLEDPATRR